MAATRASSSRFGSTPPAAIGPFQAGPRGRTLRGMALPVLMGAQIMCTNGLGPSQLLVIPKGPPVMVEGKLLATVMDFAPFANIVPFPLCNAPANPTVIAATAAALGTPTPAACVPNTVAPWTTGSPTVKCGAFNVLNNSSKLQCLWGGSITVLNPGATRETVP